LGERNAVNEMQEVFRTNYSANTNTKLKVY